MRKIFCKKPIFKVYQSKKHSQAVHFEDGNNDVSLVQKTCRLLKELLEGNNESDPQTLIRYAMAVGTVAWRCTSLEIKENPLKKIDISLFKKSEDHKLASIVKELEAVLKTI